MRWVVPALGGLAVVLALAMPVAAQKAGGGGTLPGNNSGKPINIKAAKLDYFDKERKLIYTGDVIAIQGDSTLKATVLTILLMPKAPETEGKPAGGSNQVKIMYAKGPVTILQPGQVGTGDNGVFDKIKNTMVLTGNVTWSQGPNVTKGDKLVYNLTTGQANVSSEGGGKPVFSMFEPESNNTPAPAAAADPAPAKPAAKRRAKSAKSGG